MAVETHQVDVFHLGGQGGNPLTVQLYDREPSDREMMDQAGEADSMEVAFVDAEVTSPVQVRVFTDRREIPFSGHAALGVAWVVRRRLTPDAADEIDIAMPLGDTHVRFEGDAAAETAWLTAPTIELGSAWPARDVHRVLGLRGVPTSGLTPPQLTGAGLPFLIVPVPGLAQLQSCVLDSAAFKSFAVQMVRHKALNAVVYVFCRETRSADHQIAARLFLPGDEEGAEDPASGAAAACLGAYLTVHGGLDAVDGQLRIEQGYEMGRGSLLRVRSGVTQPGIEVGGAVQPASDGP
jgi:trans-2,3-dihydro-3-hydroxyanthranilate isomerase